VRCTKRTYGNDSFPVPFAFSAAFVSGKMKTGFCDFL
jgi:hypothetical protein